MLTNRQGEKEKNELKQSGISPEDTPSNNAVKKVIDGMPECEEEQEIRTMRIFKRIKKIEKQQKT